jgi:Uma2 family endonuclease
LAKQAEKRGAALTEAGVLTDDGVKVPDVAWAEAAHVRQAEADRLYLRAPALCVEVMSPSNTMAEMQTKMALYFAAGAQEVWLCDEAGGLRFFAPATVRSPESNAALPEELRTSTLFEHFPHALEEV